MENVTDALIMAASVLLFIIALTVSITSFSSLRMQVDKIIDTTDNYKYTTDATGGYINYIKNTDDRRKVKVDSIISTIRRVRKESYTVYIKLKPGINYVQAFGEENSNLIVANGISQRYGSEEIIKGTDQVIKIKVSEDKSGQNIELTDELMEELYNVLKSGNKEFQEYLGIYQNKTAEGVSSANKTTYRVITFIEI